MPGIFISYRRGRTSAYAGRLYDRLAAEFAEDLVFMDLTAIDPGADFVQRIEQGVGEADVLLVVIGPDWLGVTDASGRPRLDDPDDFVRREVLEAKQKETLIVPVLVEGAAMPTAEQLAPPLAFLATRNAIELTDSGWSRDVSRLIETLKRHVQLHGGRLSRARRRRNRVAVLMGALGAVGVAAAAFSLAGGGDDGEGSGGSGRGLTVKREVPVGGFPLYASVAGDKVWVALENASRLKALGRNGGATSDSPPLGRDLSGLTSDGDKLWVGAYGEEDTDGRGTVVRLDPATGRPRGPRIRTLDPYEIATDGRWMWVTDTVSLDIIDLKRDEATGRLDDVDEPFDVALLNGTAWVVDSKAGRLLAFDASSGRAQERPRDVGALPVSVAAAGAYVWVATAQGQLVRVPAEGGRARSAAVGAEGNRVVEADGRGVWVVDAQGLVVLVDPGSLEVLGRLRLKGDLQDVALDSGGAWVLRSRSGQVSEVVRVVRDSTS